MNNNVYYIFLYEKKLQYIHTGGALAAPPLNAPSSVLFLTPWYWAALAALAASICD